MKTLFQKFLLQFDEDVTVADVQTSGSNSEPKEGGTAVPSRPPRSVSYTHLDVYKRQVYGHPAHPYTKGLLSAVPVADPDYEKTHRRIPMEGERCV